jgi:hypothetical protein
MPDPYLSLDVYVLRSGQPRAYADSVSEYRIENKSNAKFDKNYILKFCTKFLCPAKLEKEREGWWESYYEFEQIDERTFKYVVTTPYTD